jgi:hypothetical protein
MVAPPLFLAPEHDVPSVANAPISVVASQQNPAANPDNSQSRVLAKSLLENTL